MGIKSTHVGKTVKNTENMNRVQKIAYCCECSPQMVRYVEAGERGDKRETPLSNKIKVASMLLSEGENALLNEIKRIVKI